MGLDENACGSTPSVDSEKRGCQPDRARKNFTARVRRAKVKDVVGCLTEDF